MLILCRYIICGFIRSCEYCLDIFSGVLLGYVDIVQIHYLWFYLVMCILCGYIFGFLLVHVDSYNGGLLGHVDNVWIHFLFFFIRPCRYCLHTFLGFYYARKSEPRPG